MDHQLDALGSGGKVVGDWGEEVNGLTLNGGLNPSYFREEEISLE